MVWKARLGACCGRNVLCCITLFIIVVIIVVMCINAAYTPSKITFVGDNEDDFPAPDDQFDRVVWFMQISDTHISVFSDTQLKQLEQFLNETIPSVNPGIVIHTGDITDAYSTDFGQRYVRMNQQMEEEWEDYKNLLIKYGFHDPNFWLDIRGNHDAFGLDVYNSTENMYVYNGVHGKRPRHYSHLLNTTFGSTYGFVATDMTFDIGLKAPFQFWGVKQEMDLLQSTVKSTTAVADQTILFGHYPRSLTSTLYPWNTVTKSISVYLCGHFHAAGMYHRMKGYLELELQDMKMHKKYRILSYDHELFSFVDATLDEWPVILITNPKDARFLTEHEPVGIMGKSSHIRVLVFGGPIGSDSLQVTVSLDGGDPKPMTRAAANESLFVYPWNPQDYAEGLHKILVRATNVDIDETSEVEQYFSLDGQVAQTDINLPVFIQSTSLHHLLIFIFCWSFFGLVIYYVIIPKIYVTLILRDKDAEVSEIDDEDEFLEAFKKSYLNELIERANMHTVSFVTLILYAIDILVGPIFAGPIVDFEKYGFVVMYGALTMDDTSPAVEALVGAIAILWLLFWACTHFSLSLPVIKKDREEDREYYWWNGWTRFSFWLVLLCIFIIAGMVIIGRFLSGYGALLGVAIWWFPVFIIVSNIIILIVQAKRAKQSSGKGEI